MKQENITPGRWTGECLRCGKCCSFNINWIGFNNEEEKRKLLDFAKCRGYNVTKIFHNTLKAVFFNPCSKLIHDNECVLHNNEKPEYCKEWPMNIDASLHPDCDINDFLLDGCGFKYIYE